MRRAALAAALVCAGAAPAAAQVRATDAWARGTAPGQTSSAVYMRLRSTEPAAVVAVESPLGVAELHEMKMDGDIMRMRLVRRLELPAGRTVELNPGGAHVMLTALKRPLARGDRVPVRLTVETAGTPALAAAGPGDQRFETATAVAARRRLRHRQAAGQLGAPARRRPRACAADERGSASGAARCAGNGVGRRVFKGVGHVQGAPGGP
jgi:periplasmic copper chaperone A